MDHDKPTGLVLVNTDKGLSALDWSNMTTKETTADVALRHNPAYCRSVAAHHKRDEFFLRLEKTESVNSLITDCLRPTFKQRIRMLPSICKHLIKKMLRFVIGRANEERLISNDVGIMNSIPNDSKIRCINFRNKQNGWKSYRMEIIID